MKRLVLTCLLSCAIVFAATAAASAQQAAQDKAAIEKAVASYVKAFNARDAKALAAHWSPEGVYTSRLSGEEITGRDALQQEFAALFDEAKNVKLEVSSESIEFVSPNVAIERGQAKVIRPDADPANCGST